jgi:cytochrome c-type biogenesis protein CcmH/NrfG
MVRPGRKNMKLLLVTAVTITTALAVSPASAQKAAAQKTGCTSENMAKLVASSNATPDSPGKFAMMKEMGAANVAMSKGDMRSACKSYMRAQQMSGQKS